MTDSVLDCGQMYSVHVYGNVYVTWDLYWATMSSYVIKYVPYDVENVLAIATNAHHQRVWIHQYHGKIYQQILLHGLKTTLNMLASISFRSPVILSPRTKRNTPIFAWIGKIAVITRLDMSNHIRVTHGYDYPYLKCNSVWANHCLYTCNKHSCTIFLHSGDKVPGSTPNVVSYRCYVCLSIEWMCISHKITNPLRRSKTSML